MSSFSSMSKTASGIPVIYNVEKNITNEVEIFFFKKK